MRAFRSLDPFRALREPDRRRRDEEPPSRSEQRTPTNQNTTLQEKPHTGSNPAPSSGESTNFRFLAIRQIDDAFFDNGRARAAGQRAARRDELPAADPTRSVSSHDDRRPAAS